MSLTERRREFVGTIANIEERITSKNRLIAEFQANIIGRLQRILTAIQELQARLRQILPRVETPEGEPNNLQQQLDRCNANNARLEQENGELRAFIGECQQSITTILRNVTDINVDFIGVDTAVHNIEQNLGIPNVTRWTDRGDGRPPGSGSGSALIPGGSVLSAPAISQPYLNAAKRAQASESKPPFVIQGISSNRRGGSTKKKRRNKKHNRKTKRRNH